jgi:putative transposase
MARNYYSEIFLHLVWRTVLSRPLLTDRIAPLAYRALRRKILETPGACVHEIGGIESHVHLAITVPPTIQISEFVGQLKGASAHEVNQSVGAKVLQWQAGYGVVSFGAKDLSWVVAYIRGQREHHARGQLHDRLERMIDVEQNSGAQAADGQAS